MGNNDKKHQRQESKTGSKNQNLKNEKSMDES